MIEFFRKQSEIIMHHDLLEINGAWHNKSAFLNFTTSKVAVVWEKKKTIQSFN